MLIVLQGPSGSGKTTLARAIIEMCGSNNIILLDNIKQPSLSELGKIRLLAEEQHVIVTTTYPWPANRNNSSDFVWKMQPILPDEFIPEAYLVK